MVTKKIKTDALDTKEIIMQTAARLFSEKGFEAVSIRELAKEAQVNIAMIAYHYGSKEGLFKAIVEDKIPKSGVQLKAIQKSEGTAWDKVSMAIDLYIERMFLSDTFNRLIFRELSLEQRPENREVIINAIEKNWRIIKQFIEEGQKSGLFKNEIDPALTVISMFSTLSMIVNNSSMAARIIGEKEDKAIFSESTKIRVKQHLKSMMKAHLLT